MFPGNLEEADVSGASHMRTTAEFLGESGDGYNAYRFPVFFPEECGCPYFHCFLSRKNLHLKQYIFPDMFIH